MVNLSFTLQNPAVQSQNHGMVRVPRHLKSNPVPAPLSELAAGPEGEERVKSKDSAEIMFPPAWGESWGLSKRVQLGLLSYLCMPR